MMMNFCDPRYKPRIFSDKVSVDGYEVTNLVSSDFYTRQKGFIAEYFIKPPVNITVAFPLNIELFRIVLNPVSGRQTANGFEIFTCSQKVRDSWLEENKESPPEDVQSAAKGLLFMPIGKAFLQVPGALCFQNVLVRRNWDTAGMEEVTSYPNHRDLRHHKMSSLNFVSHVTLKIFSTLGGSAVCLQRLEIWGQPSLSTPKPLVSLVKQLTTHRQIANHRQVTEKQKSEVKTETTVINKNEHLREVLTENGVEIPDEFIDKITCEMMTIPMLLPSGENIDLSTLEKHNAMEAKWGRSPGDPFTGTAFHSNNKAIPNSHLKSRIDKFMLDHSDNLSHLPRTLGRNEIRKEKVPLPSRLTNTSLKTVSRTESKPCNRAVNIRARKRDSNDLPCNDVSLQYKRHKRDSPELSESHFERNSRKDSLLFSLLDTQSSLESNTISKPVSHDMSLKSSLDSALVNTLRALPSFTNFSQQSKLKSETFTSRISSAVESSDDLNINTCRQCKAKDLGVLYRGACSHLVCRNCLISKAIGHLRCELCGLVSDRNDMTRVYK